MFRPLLCVLFFGYATTLPAQCPAGGRVLDAADGLPLADVLVLATDGSDSTYTDRRGRFRLPDASCAAGGSLRFRKIGYEDLETVLPATRTGLSVSLAATTYAHEAFTFSAQSAASYLRPYLANIPVRYPTVTEEYRGRTTEAVSMEGQVIYHIEAQTTATKLGYRERNAIGRVRVDSSVITRVGTVPISIIAGVHNVHRFDAVKRRLGPLHDRRLDNYRLRFGSDTRDDGLVRIDFSHPKMSGYLLLNPADTSIVRVDYDVEGEMPDEPSLLANTTERVFLRFTTHYGRSAGRYRIDSIHYRTAFQIADQRVDLSNRYVRLDRSPVASIAWRDAFGYDRALRYYVDSTQLLPTDSIDLSSLIKASRGGIPRGRGLRVFFTLHLNPVSTEAGTVALPLLGRTEAVDGGPPLRFVIGSTVSYELTRALRLEGHLGASPQSFTGEWVLGPRYYLPLGNRRPWLLGAGAAFGSRQSTLRVLRDFGLAAPIAADGRTLDTPSIDAYLVRRALGTSLTLDLVVPLRTTQVRWSLSYFHPFRTRYERILEERGAGFLRRTQRIRTDVADPTGLPLLDNPLTLSILYNFN